MINKMVVSARAKKFADSQIAPPPASPLPIFIKAKFKVKKTPLLQTQMEPKAVPYQPHEEQKQQRIESIATQNSQRSIADIEDLYEGHKSSVDEIEPNETEVKQQNYIEAGEEIL